MENITGIYSIKNKINGKVYIGQTSQKPEKRWDNGKGYETSPKFFNAILKYGWDNFQHNILYSNLTANEASQKEQELIKYYNTIENGYNCEFGGLTNRKHSQETIEKLRQLNLGRNNPNYGKTASKETRLKISQSHKNIPHSKEWTEKVAKAHRKRVLCITTGEIFPSLKDAADKTGIGMSGISQVCNGIRMAAGKHPVTKEKLKWKYI